MNRRKSKHKEKLNIAMFGQKRIPSREGGVEIVVEELCTRMVAQETTLNNYDANIYKKLNIYDIGCTCSKAEGFGRVTVEYMLSGLCPIVSNTGANLEIVDDKISGIVYEKGNIQDLKEKIKYCINNIHTIEILGKEAQKKAYNNYSINIHTKNIISLYNNILKNNKEGQ